MADRLAWTDVQGDTCSIKEEHTVADADVIAAVEVFGNGTDAAVWATREQATALRDWLNIVLDD